LEGSSGRVGIGTNSPDANLTVNGAASFAAGTAAAPSIARSGDLNTGIFFPAADTIAFSEGGTEAMRINSSGNVGIGTSVVNQKFLVQDGAITTRNTNLSVAETTYEDLEMARFQVFGTGRSDLSALLQGTLYLHIGAIRSASTHDRRHAAIEVSLNVIQIGEGSATNKLNGSIVKIDESQFENGTSGSLTVDLILEYSIDGGVSFVAIPDDGTATSTYSNSINPLIRVRADLSGSEPADMRRLIAYSSFFGNQKNAETISLEPTIIV
jgi:hypothetical protein